MKLDKTCKNSRTAGFDYTSITSTITFFAGQREASITVFTLEDTTAEQLEDFSALLSNPSEGLDIGARDTATINIMDNEGQYY